MTSEEVVATVFLWLSGLYLGFTIGYWRGRFVELRKWQRELDGFEKLHRKQRNAMPGP